MEEQRRKRVSTAVQFVLSVLVLAAAAFIFLNRQYVLDSYALYRYEPTAEIETLRDNTAMTETGERYFYASHPEINTAEEFNTHCNANGEQTIILGCYTAFRIFIFNVTDNRLSGIKEVTAAHEMLHAAYDRLGENEKSQVNAMLARQANDIRDKRILGLIELYEKNDPTHVSNEIHSIFGTEVAELSSELEEYYSRYFTDRQKVVRYSQQYEAVFAQIESRQQEIVNELNSLSEEVARRSGELSRKSDELAADIEAFNKKADTPGGFSSQAEADLQRAPLVARRDALESERAAIMELIDRAKKLEKEYEQLSGELRELNNTIDSTPEELPSI